jgi:hypothetical protein
MCGRIRNRRQLFLQALMVDLLLYRSQPVQNRKREGGIATGHLEGRLAMRLHHETRRHRQLERRYTLIAGVALAAGLCAGVWGLATTRPPTAPAPLRTAAVEDEGRVGTILHAANGRCRSFDNDNGRTAAADSGCERKPVEHIHGTAGRLEAIRKSAFGNK